MLPQVKYHWVRIAPDSPWIVAAHEVYSASNDFWATTGEETLRDSRDFAVIGPEIIPPDQEVSTD